MNLLGFDTSTAVTTACVLRDDGERFEVVPDVAALSRAPAHARELLPALSNVMERSELGFADLAGIAVGVGPGSFTGLRIGIATARGIAHAVPLPLHPVSSLAALAAGIEGPVALPLIDAKRGEVFGALYRGRDLAVEPFVARPEELDRRLQGVAEAIGAAGDGSIRFRRLLEAAGVGVAPDDSQSHLVRALNVCRLAAELPSAPPQSIVPVYLRAPDVQEANERPPT